MVVRGTLPIASLRIVLFMGMDVTGILVMHVEKRLKTCSKDGYKSEK